MTTMTNQTTINDVVLIYLQDKPLSFARVEAIDPDHKRGWYHVKLLLLQIPLQVVTWILREAYINGESFTMDGNPMRIEKIINPEPEDEFQPPEPNQSTSKHSKVISIIDLKKK